MTSCEHIRANAAALAALDGADDERVSAYAHAQGCAACTEALREGERLVAWIDADSLPYPSAESLARARAAVLAQFPAARGRSLLAAAGAAVSAGAVFGALLLLARHAVLGARGPAEAAIVVAASMACAAGAVTGRWAPGAIALAFSAVFAAYGASEGSLAAVIGTHCLVTELVAALVPLGVAVILSARRVAPRGAAYLASSAAAGALAAQAALHLTCGASQAPVHLWAFHAGGVLLAFVVGAAASRIPALRAEP